jgi:hypothetical protein
MGGEDLLTGSDAGRRGLEAWMRIVDSRWSLHGHPIGLNVHGLHRRGSCLPLGHHIRRLLRWRRIDRGHRREPFVVDGFFNLRNFFLAERSGELLVKLLGMVQKLLVFALRMVKAWIYLQVLRVVVGWRCHHVQGRTALAVVAIHLLLELWVDQGPRLLLLRSEFGSR